MIVKKIVWCFDLYNMEASQAKYRDTSFHCVLFYYVQLK